MAKTSKANTKAPPPEVSMLKTELGMMRLFGTEDIGAHGLVSGWAEPEDAHVWNNGPVARFALAMEMPKAACRLVVEGGPFVTPRQPAQEITLYANGAWLGFWRFREADNCVMEAVIEPEMFLSRGDNGVLNLAWHIPTSVKPSDIGLSGDARELGFVFRTLMVVP